MTQREAASKLNVSQSTIQRILKERQEIEGSVNSDRKRFRTGKAPDVDAALIKWIHDALEKNAPLSGPLIMQKAEELARKLNHSTFKATDGWLSRFKKRVGLVHKRLHCGGQALDTLSDDHWINMPSRDQCIDTLSHDLWIDRVWPELRQAYADEDIWNTDESGIYIRALPDTTLTLSTERITALFTCSMTGDKRKLLVVGKSKAPHCFKGVESLPVAYNASTSSWMTWNLFTNWLKDWDKELRIQQRNILLLLDNCTAHLPNVELTNIRLSFFPPNTSSVLQPCEQGIISVAKAHFRHRLCRSVIEEMENASRPAPVTEVAEKISLLDTIHLLSRAWEEVEPVTIRNCWVKCGLKVGPEEQLPVRPLEDFPVPQELWDAWLTIEEDLPVAGPMSDDTIIAEVKQEMINHEDEDGEANNNDDEVTPPTNEEMRNALSVLKKGLYVRGFNDILLLNRFEHAVNDSLRDEAHSLPHSDSTFSGEK